MKEKIKTVLIEKLRFLKYALYEDLPLLLNFSVDTYRLLNFIEDDVASMFNKDYSDLTDKEQANYNNAVINSKYNVINQSHSYIDFFDFVAVYCDYDRATFILNLIKDFKNSCDLHQLNPILFINDLYDLEDYFSIFRSYEELKLTYFVEKEIVENISVSYCDIDYYNFDASYHFDQLNKIFLNLEIYLLQSIHDKELKKADYNFLSHPS